MKRKTPFSNANFSNLLQHIRLVKSPFFSNLCLSLSPCAHVKVLPSLSLCFSNLILHKLCTLVFVCSVIFRLFWVSWLTFDCRSFLVCSCVRIPVLGFEFYMHFISNFEIDSLFYNENCNDMVLNSYDLSAYNNYFVGRLGTFCSLPPTIQFVRDINLSLTPPFFFPWTCMHFCLSISQIRCS